MIFFGIVSIVFGFKDVIKKKNAQQGKDIAFVWKKAQEAFNAGGEQGLKEFCQVASPIEVISNYDYSYNCSTSFRYLDDTDEYMIVVVILSYANYNDACLAKHGGTRAMGIPSMVFEEKDVGRIPHTVN